MPEIFEQHFAHQEETEEAKPKTLEQIKEERALKLAQEIKAIKERIAVEGAKEEDYQKIIELVQEIKNIYENDEEKAALELISDEQEYWHDIQEELDLELKDEEKQNLQQEVDKYLQTLSEAQDEEGNLDYLKIEERRVNFRREHKGLLRKFYAHNIQSTGITVDFELDYFGYLKVIKGENNFNHFLEFLKHPNCKVREISLRGNNIGDAGAQELANALQNPDCKVRGIYLTRNNIGDAGAQELAEALQNPDCKVRGIYLPWNNIGDAGAQELAKALQNPNCKVREINLTRNNIGNAGAQELAKALQNPNCKVRVIYLERNNNIRDNNINTLRDIAKTKGLDIYLD